MTEAGSAAVQQVAETCQRTLSLSGKAIRYDDIWVDWGDIRKISDEVERALGAAGARPGAAVAFAPRNRPSSLAAFLPLMAQRRCIRMIYPFQSADALAESLMQLDVAAVIMDEADFTAPVIEVLQQKGVAGVALAHDRASLVAEAAFAKVDTSDQAPRLEILTSGTTGPPKHFPIGYEIVEGYIRQAEASEPQSPLPTLLCFPLSNISGLYTLAASFLRGQPVILLERFTVKAWRDYVVEFRPPSGGAPPAAVAMILADDIPVEDLASLTCFSTGAAPLDPVVQRRFEERYGVPILQTYGATEFGGPVTAMTPQFRREFGDEVSGSVGRPFGGAKVRIRKTDGSGLASAREAGIVEVVSPRMGDEWIVTSDLGFLDDNGFLFLQGRADGAIMRGGFKILPEVVEKVLLQHPSIASCSVVALPDDRLLEVPAAAIELEGRSEIPSEMELETHVRASLPAPNVPVRWKIVDGLPRTVSFKVDRAAVRDLFVDENPSPDR